MLYIYKDFPGGSGGKASACNAGDPGQSLDWKDPLEKEMATHSSILPGEIPGKRNLAGYSPWRCKRFGHDLVAKQVYVYI